MVVVAPLLLVSVVVMVLVSAVVLVAVDQKMVDQCLPWAEANADVLILQVILMLSSL